MHPANRNADHIRQVMTNAKYSGYVDRQEKQIERFKKLESMKIPDRTKAITRAIELAQPRDIVLIAGKGHETYQEFADHTVPFDDLQVARRALENHPLEF
jgi:UDP-N-acetylmuramyl tripeptide synthase